MAPLTAHTLAQGRSGGFTLDCGRFGSAKTTRTTERSAPYGKQSCLGASARVMAQG